MPILVSMMAPSHAQSPNNTQPNNTQHYSFRSIESEAIDAIGEVWDVIEDPVGFIWISGSNGLARYDGYEVKLYVHDSNNPKSLSDNTVIDMLIDQQGQLWLATQKGLNRYHRELDNFIRLNEDKTWCITQTRDGAFWVGNLRTGLKRYSSDLGKIDHIKHASPSETFTYSNTKDSLSDNTVFALHEDTRGNLWVGTANGLNRYMAKEKSFQRYRFDGKEGSISNSGINTMYNDKHGNLWIGTRYGLNRYDHEHDRFTRYLHDPNTVNSLSNNSVSSIFENDQGQLWVSTEGGGINIYRPEQDGFDHVKNDNKQLDSLPNDKIRHSFKDSTGNLWFGHYPKGLTLLDRSASSFMTYSNNKKGRTILADNTVNAVSASQQGGLWIGTENGLNYLDLDNGNIEHFAHDTNDPNSLSTNPVLSVLEDSHENLWVGTWMGGLNRFDKKTRTFARMKESNGSSEDSKGIAGSQIWSLLEGSAGDLWIGTSFSLNRYNSARDEYTSYRYSPQVDIERPSGLVRTLFEDSKNRLWIGTQDGLWQMNQEQETFTRYHHRGDDKRLIEAMEVQDIAEDKSGRIWLATRRHGLVVLNPALTDIQQYDTRNGLPSLNVVTIKEDKQGFIWAATNRGISRFDPETASADNYTQRHGIAGDLHARNASAVTQSGLLVFGSTDGLTVLDPTKQYQNDTPLRLQITDFQILNKSVRIGVPSSPLHQSISTTKQLQLTPNDSVFSFAFAALDYQLPQQVDYAYRLEGFDKDWQFVGNRRLASYTNLDPGKYVFHLKASNNNDVWHQHKAPIYIKILPPWWLSWWAYSVYALIIGALMWLLLYTLANRRRAKNEHQMNVQLRQVDKIKDAFLANTSHELRTPLNGIIGLSESLLEGAAGALPGKANHDLEMIAVSARRLANLVNDILDFSKLQEHTIHLKKETVNIHALTELTLGLSRPLIGNRKIRLTNKIDPKLTTISADTDRVQQVLFNLLGNAIKFTEEGSIEIQAYTKGTMLWVSVKDTGIGISPDNIDRVFNSFEQSESSAELGYSGSGLGLAVSKAIVELHGGSIALSSTLGEGSEFRFSLPLRANSGETQVTQREEILLETPDDNTSALKQIAKLSELQTQGLSELQTQGNSVLSTDEADFEHQQYHILIVDDDPINRQVLLNFLGFHHYRTSECESGAEVFALFEQQDAHDIDLILLDVMMPKISGYEVCQTLRQKYPTHHLPILFLTAKNQHRDLEAAFSSGGNDYLTKPILKSELLARLQTQLELSQVSRKLENVVLEKTHDLQKSHNKLQTQHLELKQMQSQLVQSEKMSSLGVLIAGVGHELSNPAHFTRGSAVNLSKAVADFHQFLITLAGDNADQSVLEALSERIEILTKDLDIINDGTERIQGIVNNLRTFARRDSPKLQRTQLKKGLLSTLYLVESSYKSLIEIDCKIEDNPAILCSPGEINQVFMNLMVNACQAIVGAESFIANSADTAAHSSHKTYRLSIYMRIVDRNLRINICDNGPGIPPEVLPKIFDPFFTTKKEGEGTGLGLSISYQIIQRNHGSIQVNSELGKGSDFQIEFPLLTDTINF